MSIHDRGSRYCTHIVNTVITNDVYSSRVSGRLCGGFPVYPGCPFAPQAGDRSCSGKPRLCLTFHCECETEYFHREPTCFILPSYRLAPKTAYVSVSANDLRVTKLSDVLPKRESRTIGAFPSVMKTGKLVSVAWSLHAGHVNYLSECVVPPITRLGSLVRQVSNVCLEGFGDREGRFQQIRYS